MEFMRTVLKLFWKNTERMDNKRIASQTPTPGIKTICDIPYINDGEKAHLLDIYYPEGTKDTDRLPVIIDIHGGGWLYGYKEINKYFCLKLAEKGFVVASINYRLADTVRFYEQIQDIFAALSFLKNELTKYPTDMENVFLCGDSAGGHFACVTAVTDITPDYQKEFGVEPTGLKFRAVGAICPAVDLISPNPMLNIQLGVLLGKNYKKSKYYKYMDFSQIATYKLPPFYVVTCNGDFLRTQGYRLRDILDEYGVKNFFEDYNDKLDGKKLQHVFGVVDPYTVPAAKFISAMTGYFLKNAKETAEKEV